MPGIYPISLLRDFWAFHRALFLRKDYEPEIHLCSGETSAEEPSQEQWLAYYSTCVNYITSLHNQFVAVLSIQGALAIGCVAAIHLLNDEGTLAGTLGWSIAVTELALMIVAMKLFRQHCVICWMLRRVEQTRLGLPIWAGMKARIGTEGNRLFTSPMVYIVTILYGVFLAIGLGVASYGGFP